MEKDDLMKVICIVGSRSLEGNSQAEKIIRGILARYSKEDTQIISGGAKGIDTMAIQIAKEMGFKTYEYLPYEKIWWSYKGRNIKMAEACDELYRISDSRSGTYGSGWTRDYAAKLGKLTQGFEVET